LEWYIVGILIILVIPIIVIVYKRCYKNR